MPSFEPSSVIGAGFALVTVLTAGVVYRLYVYNWLPENPPSLILDQPQPTLHLKTLDGKPAQLFDSENAVLIVFFRERYCRFAGRRSEVVGWWR